MKKSVLLLVCVLVFLAGCTPENGENSVPAEESYVEDVVSDVESDTEEDVFIEADYKTVIFSSFEEIAQIALISNEEDYSEYYEKDGGLLRRLNFQFIALSIPDPTEENDSDNPLPPCVCCCYLNRVADNVAA